MVTFSTFLELSWQPNTTSQKSNLLIFNCGRHKNQPNTILNKEKTLRNPKIPNQNPKVLSLSLSLSLSTIGQKPNSSQLKITTQFVGDGFVTKFMSLIY